MTSAGPLSEISPMGVRRNSPSVHQASFVRLRIPEILFRCIDLLIVHQKSPVSGDSSPFDPSPAPTTSPRSFWKGRESPSPTRIPRASNENVPFAAPGRRSSIEKLQKASRVKNSNMFARETQNIYDPDTSSIVDRPLAAGRPLSAFSGNIQGSNSLPSSPSKAHAHRRTESNARIPLLSPTKATGSPLSPHKVHQSPQKSSLATRHENTGSIGSADGVGSDEDRSGTPRPHKTVSFQEHAQVNHYEMITPDPSSIASGSREGSYDLDEFDPDDSYEDDEYRPDDSFDESLEDTAKTPVVMPEDWRFMSPKNANRDLADTFTDPFAHEDAASSPLADRRVTDRHLSRSESVNSDGERRPLPPLPARMMAQAHGSPGSASRHSVGKQEVKAPRPASISKEDILGMRHDHMPLDERLRLLALQQAKSGEAAQDVTAPAESVGTQGSPGPSIENDEDQDEDVTQTLHAPSISRQSIMEKVKSRQGDVDDSDLPSSPLREGRSYADIDPDEPIASRETSSNYNADDVHNVVIKQEHDDEKPLSMYPAHESSPEYGRESSVIRHDVPKGHGFAFGFQEDQVEDSQFDPDEPMPSIESHEEQNKANEDQMGLPDFTSSDDFSFSFHQYMSPDPPSPLEAQKKELKSNDDDKTVSASSETEQSSVQGPTQDEASETITDVSPTVPMIAEQTPSTSPQLADDLRRPHTPSQLRPESPDQEPGTPDSVIHHPIEYNYDESGFGEAPEEEVVPEEVATIRAPGGKLKTRESATVYDLECIRDQAFGGSSDESRPSSGSSQQSEAVQTKADLNRRLSNRMKLDIPLGEDLGTDLDQEFDKVIEAQKVRELYPIPEMSSPVQDCVTQLNTNANSRTPKRGYLMRQNTKVVVASNRQASGSSSGDGKENDESSKPDATRKVSGKVVTTEPWNGKMRRQSSRRSGVGVALKGAVPPLPGQESNAQTLDAVNEESLVLDADEGQERGRLFVKVLGVKDLDLPLPKHERNWFQLTLDNGLHCVTTAWLELGRKAPIGQEFELTVFKELDFSLTLQTKLERPKSASSSIDSISAKAGKKEKGSTFSRFLQSPKKRREMEKKQHEEEAMAAALRMQELEAQRASRMPTSWDLLHDLVGADGSFARSIVSLEDHEQQAFGRPYGVDVPCFNSWATETTGNTPSTRSKHGGVQRRPPYKIGNLELQLLYIPKPKGIKDEDMPQSMSSAIRQLREAEANAAREYEGFLSQQGGDCPYWRRRFFRLNGSNLTSYHESTRQRRANINLAKAAKLIDDRSSLTQPDGKNKGGKSRRRSAFGEEEEGYMFVEEGFRIRFANGEIIDFYADNREQKEGWMRMLSDVVGKDLSPNPTSWTAAVMARRKLALPSQPGKATPQPGSARSAPTSPMKSAARPQSMYEKPAPPLPGEKSPKRKAVGAKLAETPQLTPTPWDGAADARERRKNVRSMIF